MSDIIKIALEQNEKMYKEMVEFRKENEMLVKELVELKEKIAHLELHLSKDNVNSDEDLKKIKSDLSYLTSKQRSRDFDWDIGY